MQGWGVRFSDAGTRGTLLGCDVVGAGEVCVVVKNGADPSIFSSFIHAGSGIGVRICSAGTGRLCGNDIWDHRKACCVIEDGSDASFIANKIHGGSAAGVAILGVETWARLGSNEIWGHAGIGLEVSGGAAAEVSGNSIRFCHDVGVLIDGTSQDPVRLYNNLVFGNVGANVVIQGGSDPVVEGNFVHSVRSPAASAGQAPAPWADQPTTAGMIIEGSNTRGRLNGNHLYRNGAANLLIKGGSDPLVVGNKIYGGAGCGVFLCGLGDSGRPTRGTLRRNAVLGHRTWEIIVKNGSNPFLEDNELHDGHGSGVHFSGPLTGGVLRNNVIHSFPSSDSTCLFITECLSLEVAGNRINGGGGDGVVVNSGSRCALTGNDVGDHRKSALVIKCYAEPLVSDNRIYNSHNGVLFDRASGSLLQNRIWSHASVCVCIGSYSNPLVSGNAIYAGGKVGVGIWGPSSGRLEANAIFENDKAGVHVKEGGRPVLSGNLICGNAGIGVMFSGLEEDITLVGAGNIFSRNHRGDVIVKSGGGSVTTKREAFYYDRVICAGCGALDAETAERCGECVGFGAPFSPCYCGESCRQSHVEAHKAECRRAPQRAREWVHALDALLDLPGCPYGHLEVLAWRQRQRKLEAGDR